jgi:hypothetical protein
MELNRQQQEEEGGSSQQLKKYVPSGPVSTSVCDLENPETLTVSSTYDGAFTCVMGIYLLEKGRSPCGRPIYNKPGQPLFILYAGPIDSWVFAESPDSRLWRVLWRVRSDAMTPMEITETWEAVSPICYDSNGWPVVNRGLYQYELSDLDSQGYVVWDKVEDIEFSSSLFPQIPDACPGTDVPEDVDEPSGTSVCCPGEEDLGDESSSSESESENEDEDE